MVFLREMVNNEQAKQQMLSYRNSVSMLNLGTGDQTFLLSPFCERVSMLQKLGDLEPGALKKQKSYFS